MARAARLEPRRQDGPRGGRGRAAARGALAAGGARRRGRRGLDECLASGMLTSEPAGVAFRHELARLAVDESVAPHRKVGLHRAALGGARRAPVRCARSGPARAPRRRRRRRRRRASLRTRGSCRARRLSARTARRRRSTPGHCDSAIDWHRRARGAARAPLPRVLRDRRAATRRSRRSRKRSSVVGSSAKGSRRAARFAGSRRSSCAQAGIGMRSGWPARRSALLEALRRGASSRWPTRTWRHDAWTGHGRTRRLSWAGRALELAERLGDTEIALDATVTIAVGDSKPTRQARGSPRARAAAGSVEHVGRAFVRCSWARRSATAATTSRPLTSKQGSTTAPSTASSVIGSTYSRFARASCSSRAAGQRRPSPPTTSFVFAARRSRRVSSRSWCSGSCAHGVETPATRRRSRRRGHWQSRPGTSGDCGP